jgi:hypothetical protein
MVRTGSQMSVPRLWVDTWYVFFPENTLLKVYRSIGNALLIVYVKSSKNKLDQGWAKYGPRRLLVRPGRVVFVK